MADGLPPLPAGFSELPPLPTGFSEIPNADGVGIRADIGGAGPLSSLHDFMTGLVGDLDSNIGTFASSAADMIDFGDQFTSGKLFGYGPVPQTPGPGAIARETLTGDQGLLPASLVEAFQSEPQTPQGKIAGGIAKHLPGAFFPGGALPSVVGGTIAGTADALGASETVQDSLGLVASLLSPTSAAAKGPVLNAARQMQKNSLGMTKQAAKKNISQLSRGQKAARMAADESLTDDMMKTMEQSGVLKGSRKPSQIIARNEDTIKGLLDDVDSVINPIGEVSPPSFARTQEILQKIDVNESDYITHFTKRLGEFRSSLKKKGTTAKTLNDFKRQLYKGGYDDGNIGKIQKTVDRAMAHDLKEAIEQAANGKLGPEAMNKLIDSNKKLGHHINFFDDVLIPLRASEEGPKAISNLLRRFAVSPASAGTAVGLAPLLGFGSPLMSALSIGAGAATTRTGQHFLSGGAHRLSGLLGALSGSPAGALPAIASLTKEEGAPQKKTFGSGFSLINEARADDSVVSLKDTKLPTKGPELIKELSMRSVVPTLPELSEGLMDRLWMKESSGRPWVEGPTTKWGKAKGLAQFLDDTGKQMHKELGIEEPYDPFSPRQAALLSTYYMQKLTKRFGKEELALAAYNWGPTRLAKLIKREGTSEYSKLKQFLPEQTKDYVKVIAGV